MRQKRTDLSKLPRDLPGKKVISYLNKICFKEQRTRGSHCLLRRGEKAVTVPLHDELSVGIVKQLVSLLEDLGYSKREAIGFLKVGRPVKASCSLSDLD
ncbi:MAG: type II toxin-antitoxin system HicA family toxin [Candidatus Caldarchaeales archaeon]